jgi:uncharacterized protein (DUF2252 family)
MLVFHPGDWAVQNIVEAMRDFNTGRAPDLLALKLHRMRQDPFTFLRGSCHRYYQVLPNAIESAGAPQAWICGDLHLENFGSYLGDDGLPHFDLNDFDEAVLAPLSWDLVRVLSSLSLACQGQALSKDHTLAQCQRWLATYGQELALGHPRWLERDSATGPVGHLLRQVRQRTAAQILAKRTQIHQDVRRLRVDGLHLLPASPEQRTRVDKLLRKHVGQTAPHQPLVLMDVARRVAGTGSLGLERYLLLVQPAEHADGTGTGGRPRLLDLKLAAPSSLNPVAPSDQPAWPSEAARIVTLQSRLQAAPTSHIFALTGAKRSWVLRHLQASDDRIAPLAAMAHTEHLAHLLSDLARVTAWAHLRGAGRQGAASIDRVCRWAARKPERWQRAVLRAAASATAQVQRDWRAFGKAYDRGDFAALTR